MHNVVGPTRSVQSLISDTVYVAVVDDNKIYRYIAKNKISEMSGVIVIIEADNGEDLISKLKVSPIVPQICILDLFMPVMNGYETIKILSEEWPLIRTLVVSQFCQSYAIENMLSLGARGFISKEDMLHCLPEAVLEIAANGFYYSSLVGRDLFDGAKKKKIAPIQFTNVEKEIISLLCQDLQYNEIASRLFKSPRTIEKHKQNISHKIGISSREGLILFAIKNELSSPI